MLKCFNLKTMNIVPEGNGIDDNLRGVLFNRSNGKAFGLLPPRIF
jgi:hypothetical protein